MIEEHLGRREAFAVSLRRQRKTKILAQRRALLLKRGILNDHPITRGEAPDNCLQSLHCLDGLLRKPKNMSSLPHAIYACLTELSQSLKMFSLDRARAVAFMTEQCAIFNICQVFAFLVKKTFSKRLSTARWDKLEIKVLFLCFDLFELVDASQQWQLGLTNLVFDMMREATR